MLLKNWKNIWKKTKTLHYADVYIYWVIYIYVYIMYTVNVYMYTFTGYIYIYWVIYMTLIEVSRLKASCNISVVVELVSEQCIFIFLLFSLEIR